MIGDDGTSGVVVTTVSQQAIEDIRSAFVEAEVAARGYSFANYDDAAAAATNLLRKAGRIERSSLDLSVAVQIARLLGKYRAIALTYQRKDQAALATARMGQIFRDLLVPNRDEARLAGSEMLERCANEYLVLRDRRAAGIELTNAGLLRVEMYNATTDQLQYAMKLLQRGRDLKKGNRVDWAYSEFNIGICLKNLYKNNPSQLERAHKCLKDACKVFDASASVEKYRTAYLAETCEALIDWWNASRNILIAKLVSKNLNDMPEQYHATDIDRVQLFHLLKSNPQAIGLSATPDWVADVGHPTIPRNSFPAPEVLLEELRQELDQFPPGSADHTRLRWFIHRISSELLGRDDFDDALASMLSDWFDKGNFESFFVYARDVLPSVNVSVEARRGILTRMLTCVEHFRRTWAERDIERFLLRNPVQLRFVACQLAEVGNWSEAFDMLELSRGLLSSGTTSYSSVPIIKDESHFWLHITHGPDATHAIARYASNGKIATFGRSFFGLSGKYLAGLFSGPEGLLSAQYAGDMSGVSTAVSRIAASVQELVEWVKINCVNKHVVVMPGGFYQAFPIATQIYTSSLGDAIPQFASSAPSMTLAASQAEAPTVKEVGICVAADVAGFSPLKWAKLEEGLSRSSTDHLRFREVTGTKVDLISDMQLVDLMHFSGHSYAAPDPLDSSVVLHGGSLTVRDILKLRSVSKTCVLSSCQSGATFNFVRQDEYLSIQSSLFYAGAIAVIGTLWPVKDFVAFIFGMLFYRTLSVEAEVIPAFFQAIRDLATLTREQLDELLSGQDVEAPKLYSALGEQEIVFPDFSDHGAYTLMLRSPFADR
ncbi:CHAT domain-containing protein [Nocardia sp. NPDC003999]